MLSSVDVFSGIGGISLALKDFTDTLLYCEIDMYCQAVLLERMRAGDLHNAPIHSDITTLHLSKASRPVMICGGFPCQDISSMGHQKGIHEGQRSCLFHEIMRLLDECPSIQVLFLENVSNIVNCGLKDVIKECSDRGFDLHWILKSAASLGGPHTRNRWFCLAVKRDSVALDPIIQIIVDQNKTVSQWWTAESEPHSRISYKPESGVEDGSHDVNWIRRCQVLGNAVVPCVVRDAFTELCLSSKKWKDLVEVWGTEYGRSAADMSYPYPETGLVYNGLFYAFPRKPTMTQRDDFRVDMKVKFNGEVVNIANLPTPRYGNVHAVYPTSERNLHDLGTLLVYCEKSLEQLADKLPGNAIVAEGKRMSALVHPSVSYVEWMMGYPSDWTRISGATFSVFPNKNSKRKLVDVGGSSGVPEKRPERKRKGLNGMHVFMRENPGKDVREVASLWRALNDDAKRRYRELALKQQV